mgnify:FL=1
MAYKDISEYGFGQMGSVYTKTANNQIKPPTDKVFVAITFLADTQLELLATGAGGLTADTSDPNAEYIGTDVAAHDATATNATTVTGELGSTISNTQTFPRGVTIYGRWKSVEIGNGKTGALIAYLGS